MTVVSARVPSGRRGDARPPDGPGPWAPLLYRLLLAVDIQGYSARSACMQVRAQVDLLAAMAVTAEEAGLNRERWLQQVSGDGELDVLPVEDDIVTGVGRFAPALDRALGETNRRALATPRLRVRLALHHGPVIMDQSASLGPAGDAPVVVSRLLDARPLRRHLIAHPKRNVALIVSAQIYREVVCSGYCALLPEHFRFVRTTVKGSVYQGYIYDPDQK